MSRLKEVLHNDVFKNAEQFYCMMYGETHTMCLMRGKLHTMDSEGNWALCGINQQWLKGYYYLNAPVKLGDNGLNVEEIFMTDAFIVADEFIRVDSDKRFRIYDGELQYYSDKHQDWKPRTIDKGLYNTRFTLREVK